MRSGPEGPDVAKRRTASTRSLLSTLTTEIHAEPAQRSGLNSHWHQVIPL
jgi:hypothetical protein